MKLTPTIKMGGVSKSMLTLNEAIIDVKKVKSKALKWFSIFFEKLQLLLKPRLIRCLILQLLPSIPTVKNLPILCLQFLKAVMKLSQ